MSCAELRDSLICSLCSSLFTAPLTLSCGHSFCRGCVTASARLQALCPGCGAAFPPLSELELLPVSHSLHSLALSARERLERRQEPGETQPTPAQDSWRCPEHDERMKLFCVTDQQLACTICRDGEAHDGHKFKPIREAALGLRRDIDLGLDNIKTQTEKLQKLTQTQSAEMEKAKNLSAQLKSQVQKDFQSMHQFLSRREAEVLEELRLKEEDAVEIMSHSLNAMKQALSDCGERRDSWTQLKEVSDPETFLRRWSEERGTAAERDLSRSWTAGLTVVQSPLFQGPYQSHLQFFMWKEMLQVVKPRAELLSLKTDNPFLTVSADRRSFHYAPPSWQTLGHYPAFDNSLSTGGLFGAPSIQRKTGFSFGHAAYKVPQSFVSADSNDLQSLAVSTYTEFSSGQHYWEVEVGQRDFWCVGIHEYFLKYENEKYFSCEGIMSTELKVSETLLKLGLYLNCSSKTLTFYNADSMVRLHKVFCGGLTLPVSAYFSIRQREPDNYPITICRY